MKGIFISKEKVLEVLRERLREPAPLHNHLDWEQGIKQAMWDITNLPAETAKED